MCIYVFNGANQSWAGHVTGHADSKIISDFLNFLIYADVIQVFLPVWKCYTEELTILQASEDEVSNYFPPWLGGKG